MAWARYNPRYGPMMRRPGPQLLVAAGLVGASLFWGACGGPGGGTGGPTGPGPSPPGGGSGLTSPAQPALRSGPRSDASAPPATLLFYIAFPDALAARGDLEAIDPVSPWIRLSIRPDVAAARSIRHGKWDTAGKQVAGLHDRTILFVGGDGRLYRVGALQTESHRPVPVSSESGAFSICVARSEPDYADYRDAAYIYQLPGPDRDCGSAADNIWRLVRLGMDATTAPVPVDTAAVRGESAIPIRDSGGGGILGWLGTGGQGIVRCDRDFQGCAEVGPGGTELVLLAEDLFSGFLVLKIDGAIFVYDIPLGSLSPSRYTFLTPGPVAHEADTENLYFTDGGKLLRLPLDGSTATSSLATESGDILQIALTAGSVVYIVSDGGSSPRYTLKAITKTGQQRRTLDPPTTLVRHIFATAGDWVYFSGTEESTTEIGSVRDDATGGTLVEGARWVGQTGSLTLASNDRQTPLRVIWLEAAGMLRSVDASTNGGEVSPGRLPVDISEIGVSGIGENALGGGRSTPGGNADIFFVRPAEADALVRVTDTRTIHEFPLF